ncbi:DUF4339 domain-containing protein [Rhodopirellula sallentina]|uniref:GYF domain-containing protein n=1 Tax=Rhodopirellula sallentina SM41 TaxID=1263870 RepID=M5UA71_9BACT|nr:DUF4339 domain-containing protein [Rhodopirellula sallentina]EMI58315.1 hypothetical protein RSSM_00248 [Rhodopirellula sallentina SM41]
MTDWYVQREHEELGPLKPAELLSLVRDGDVLAETMVRKDDSPWFAAGEVGGLFEAARRPTIEHYCPHCADVRVSTPPATCPKCDRALVKTRQRIIEHSVGKSKSTLGVSSGPTASARRWLQRRIGRDIS